MLVAVAYYGSAFIMPSVTIVNKSDLVIEQASLSLPSSNLNFGTLIRNEENTLHYSLEQNDGVYHYQFKVKGLADIKGSCGEVLNYEFHKRVAITFTENNKVVCR